MIFSDKFICRTEEYTTYETHVPAPFFRRKFSLQVLPVVAIITVCGLGFYELYVNGKRITKGHLAPYISNPDQILYYDSYPVEQYLVEGENVIALLLGNGFLNDPAGHIWDFDKAGFRSSPKLALAFEADGKVLFEADERFLTAASPILFDDYRAGEHYDARREIPDWTLVSCDETAWQPAKPATSPKGVKKPAECEPVLFHEEYDPIEISPCKTGYVYKFPYNIAGVCRLKIKGMRGQKIRLTYGEYLKEGELCVDNLVFAGKTRVEYAHVDEYVCKGEGEEEYTPTFTYHGFQYVLVEGITKEQAQKDLLTALFLHSDIKKAGEFVCSNETVNAVQDMTIRATLSNFHYFPTDCPHREKNGWTGDILLSAAQMNYNFFVERSMREWLNNVRAAQLSSGLIPSIVPTAGWGYDSLNGPAWAGVIVVLPYECYRFSRDKTILQENFPAMRDYLGYVASRRDPNGLIGFGLGDWCQPSREEWLYETDLRITDTLTVMELCEKAEEIATVLGEGETFSHLRQELKSAFRNAFVQEGKIKEEFATQTALAMAFAGKIFSSKEMTSAKAQLLELIAVKDNRFNVGVLGARALFRTLAALGEIDLALEMVTTPAFPSFAYPLKYGATTLWEGFHEFEKGKIAPKDKRGGKILSLNHHFWGDISAWFFEVLGGISIDFLSGDVIVSPAFPKEIDWVKASRSYSGGTVSVVWKKENGIPKVRVSVPEGVRARVVGST